MKTKSKKKARFFRNVMLSALTATVLVIIASLFYCYLLSIHIDERFSGRRWSIPSRVYSDSVILYPGQKLNQESFDARLKRLGYREVEDEPEHKGELRRKGKILEIYLHDLKIPSGNREGYRAKIRFDENRIKSIQNSLGEPVPILELDPEEIMLFFGPERERRQLVAIGEVPPHMIHAVLAAEDDNFYRHRGMDFRGIMRALYVNFRSLGVKQGGSTITQQLAKNYFLTPERSFRRKFKELLMSLTIELMYEKNEILEIYLNEIYMGQKGTVAVNGLGEAASFYFGKRVNELSVAEAATIAGLIRGPNRYSPYADALRCKERRNAVLAAMRNHYWIGEAEFQRAANAPVTAVGYEGYNKKAPYFIDYLAGQLTDLYSPDDLSSMGLSIHTTLDMEVQMAAEKALEKGLARLENHNPLLKRDDPQAKLQGAVVVMQPRTGAILAMAGGRDYSQSQFNRVTQARRQPGSAFKPFVYAAALDHFTPASLLSNMPRIYDFDGVKWEPKNYKEFPQEQVTVRAALSHSINLPTVDLAMRTGLTHIKSSAMKFGFSSLGAPYPSMALGALDVIPLELARAYCPFAADGILPYPLSLKEVADEKGRILQRRHMTVTQAISPAKAFLMSSLLRDAAEEGTAMPLKQWGITCPVGAKTGTTNDFRDAWFVGFTPDILALVWVGFDDGTSVGASGTRAALPIWAELIRSLPQYVSGDWFQTPEGVVKKVICSESGLLAVRGGCPYPVEEFFLAENAPSDMCPLHFARNPMKEVINEIKSFFNRF
ncbi:MAG: PBP1A family penicillin-binding protein [Syntrophales bacterium]|jgi:penicillin-binding protein 1B|nr:PBP1A family penicillin-binding protein [Syntrophales bacterium]MDY0043741.1 PBP1A family penicillin-binding protein [Syntrophales bacterium]